MQLQPLRVPGAGIASAVASMPQLDTTSNAPGASPTIRHVVVAGDSLSQIALDYGSTVDEIAARNGIDDPSRINIGDVLEVPALQPLSASIGEIEPTTPPSPNSPEEISAMSRIPVGPIRRVETTQKLVAISFDDGPNGATTDAIAATLARKGVHATFYLVGNRVDAQRSRVRALARAGHEIANHSWDHSDLGGASADRVRNQIRRTSNSINAATGSRPTSFRPPYGSRSATLDAATAAEGLYQVTWDVDTRDWERPGTQAIVRTAVQNARAGSIILMHDGGGDRSQTQAAVGHIIDGLRARGLEPVSVRELLAARR